MNRESLNAVLASLKFTDLQGYLRNTGWERIETPKGNIALFQKSAHQDLFEAVLPLDKSFADYESRIRDVLNSIAMAEQREVEEIVADLSSPPSDVVRFRIIGRDTLGGTIKLVDGFSLLESAKKALFATACDILQPERYHRRLGLKAAQQFIEACRLGQTERGSFIASVICPFVNASPADTAHQLNLFNHSEEFKGSFTRQVTKRMMRSLETVKSHIDKGEQDRLMELSGADVISGNFLESLLELNAGREDTEIEIQTNFSALAQELIPFAHRIKFSNDYFPVIESVVARMKPASDDYFDEFVGRISQTKADPDPHTREGGEVMLNFIVGDEEKVSRARISLGHEDYEIACKAHLDGKTVKVTGKLVTSGRTKVIESPKFEVL